MRIEVVELKSTFACHNDMLFIMKCCYLRDSNSFYRQNWVFAFIDEKKSSNSTDWNVQIHLYP